MRKWYRRCCKIIGAVFLIMALMTTENTKLHAEDLFAESWIPAEYQQYCVEIGAQYSIAPELLEAIIEFESSGRAHVNNGSCKGLMQINEPYHYDRMARLGVNDIYDPYGNIMVAADYLQELFLEYGDVGVVLMVYNGSSNALQRADNGEFTDYANGIMMRSQALERIHGK